ncbi:MAG: UDP-N-acetylmuramoyl-L-alanine--D-glutamate ligase [Cyclobacteriaceae bacterium]|nr:UDP-N-acetylmuramoyl-L-alanine--D-glutamate ligase [Cyclobacteriaceae bacterium]
MKGQITILGAGISGIGAAKLAVKQGFSVFLSELNQISNDDKALLTKLGVSFEEGGHTLDKVMASEFIIKSPGIPNTVDVLKTAAKRGIPAIDELEFASRFTSAGIIMITGTNGKTTTTMLTAHILKTCGIRAVAVGNVGKSFAETVATEDGIQVYVVEASSFQLDGLKDIKTDVGVLLNITPDHLNRYGSFENYISSKHIIEKTIKKEGLFIYNADNEYSQPQFTGAASKSVSIETNKATAYVDSKNVIIEEDTGTMKVPFSEISLRGKHNMFNVMCAIIAVRHMGADWVGIKKGLASFPSVPHRLEPAGSVFGVNFINDSKATNVDAVKYALDSFHSPLVWIAGGVDKGNNYAELYDLVDKNVKALVCLGVDNERLKAAFSGRIDSISEASDIKTAVKMALDYARKNDVVLLSPACASFDLFRNYEDRGDQFKWAVSQLKSDYKLKES